MIYHGTCDGCWLYFLNVIMLIKLVKAKACLQIVMVKDETLPVQWDRLTCACGDFRIVSFVFQCDPTCTWALNLLEISWTWRSPGVVSSPFLISGRLPALPGRPCCGHYSSAVSVVSRDVGPTNSALCLHHNNSVAASGSTFFFFFVPQRIGINTA